MQRKHGIIAQDRHMTLEEKTRIYWNMSSAYYGKPSPITMLTAEQVFKSLNLVTSQLGPHRRLNYHLDKFRDLVVKGPEHRTPAYNDQQSLLTLYESVDIELR